MVLFSRFDVYESYNISSQKSRKFQLFQNLCKKHLIHIFFTILKTRNLFLKIIGHFSTFLNFDIFMKSRVIYFIWCSHRWERIPSLSCKGPRQIMADQSSRKPSQASTSYRYTCDLSVPNEIAVRHLLSIRACNNIFQAEPSTTNPYILLLGLLERPSREPWNGILTLIRL